ncbi:MAG: hypothetical protein ACR2NZ_02260, partial [Rubripirellula sp.]
MSKSGSRIGALGILAVGIAIGCIASSGAFSIDSVSQAAQNEQAATAKAQSETGSDEIPDEWMPWKDPENPNVLVLEPGSRDG